MGSSVPRLPILLVAALMTILALAATLQAAPALRAPAITGTSQVGSTLTATMAQPAPKGTAYDFEWQALKTVTVKKRPVTRWATIAGARTATFTPSPQLTGARVRACVRTRAKRTLSDWKCSGAAIIVAASASAATTPAAPTPAAPAQLGISYLSQRFVTGSASWPLPPTVTGGSGTRRFQLGPGTLPEGVTFNETTGTFTGPAASAWNFRATQIATGSYHTCALTTSGGVKCWGEGTYGQIGNGATAFAQTTPVDVVATGGSGALANVTQIAAGGSHTCALTTSGSVKCWGYGAYGQLGTNATNNQSTPVDVVATGGSGTLADVTQIAAGKRHTCALTTSGSVKCWGEGGYGRIGNNATSNQNSPVDVVATGGSGALANVTQIAAGGSHTCALTTSGGVKCWGYGGDGRLGSGATPTTQATPVDVVATGGSGTLTGITQITTGEFHTCALTTAGSVKCWGTDSSGQLGNGASSNQNSPVDVVATGGSGTLANITQIAAGSAHTCALTTSGSAKCWGYGFYGQLGTNATTDQSTPVDVVATGGSGTLTDVTQIAAGGYHTCALTTSGGAKCWGYGSRGQLGNNATTHQTTPVNATTFGGQPGFPATLTVTVTDDTGSASTPVTLWEASKPWFSYPNALLTMGQDQQQLSPVIRGGTGTTSFGIASGTLPAGVAFNETTGTFTGPAASAWNFRATQIATGSFHTCALTTSGSVKCWGYGASGQLGNNNTTNQTTPVDVVGTGSTGTLTGITQIAAGGSHTCALTTSGSVKCWGYGASGQLGNNNDTTNQNTPVDVVATGGSGTLTNIIQITAGNTHTCALTTSGSVKCWGYGYYGQLGNGATANQNTPVDVVATGGTGTLTDITQIAAGGYHTCALTTSGGAKCWGESFFGQLGNNDTTNQNTPVNVVATGGTGTLTDITQITAGGIHTCALTTSSGAKCWGSGLSGRLGNGATANQNTPVDVVATGGSGTLTNVAQITAGSAHTCALTTSGSVKCWGHGASGQLGNNDTTNQNTPVNVVATGGSGTLTNITQTTAGGGNTCALTTSSGVKCWGAGTDGQLGNNAPNHQAAPVNVTKSGQQPGFPATLAVTVTDDTGTWTLGRVVLGTR